MKETDILFHHGILISLYKSKKNQNSSDLITQSSTNPGVRLMNVPTARPVRTSHHPAWSSFPRCTACLNVTLFCLIVISPLHCLFERHCSVWSSFPRCTACSNVTVLFDRHFPAALPVRTSLFCLIVISPLHCLFEHHTISPLHCLFERHTILLDRHFPAALPIRTSHHFPAALPVRTSHHSVWSSFPCCTACSNVTPFCLIVISLLHCLFERHCSVWLSFPHCTACSNVTPFCLIVISPLHCLFERHTISPLHCLFERHTILFDRHFPAALPVRTSHHSAWSSFPCCTACSNVTPFCLIVISPLHYLFERHTILLDRHFPAALPVWTSHHFPAALPVRTSHHSVWSSFPCCTACSNVTPFCLIVISLPHCLFERHCSVWSSFPHCTACSNITPFCLIVISLLHCLFERHTICLIVISPLHCLFERHCSVWSSFPHCTDCSNVTPFCLIVISPLHCLFG